MVRELCGHPPEYLPSPKKVGGRGEDSARLRCAYVHALLMRRLVVLGGRGAYPEPGRACSGFLVEWDGFRLVLDLGYATLPRLLAHCPDAAVDAVVITHEHPDHCIDLQGLFRIHLYGPLRGRRLPLYCTPGVPTRLAALEPDVDLDTVFDIYHLPGDYQSARSP